ncbi:MAG: hypothetical protein ACRENW_03100 [Thermodesulfobacteriota bacterium]
MMAKVSRSAKTGRFVKKSYAKKHPSTTVTETVKRSKKARRSSNLPYSIEKETGYSRNKGETFCVASDTSHLAENRKGSIPVSPTGYIFHNRKSYTRCITYAQR